MRKPSGASSTRSIDVGPNTMPGWEVSGGPILGWLLDSPSSKFILSPPEGFKLSYGWGDRKEWEGTEVREVMLKIGGPIDSASLFLGANEPRLVGQEYLENKKRHWMRYRDAKENVSLADSLGNHPG